MECLEKAAKIVLEALKQTKIVQGTIVATRSAARILKLKRQRRCIGSTSGGGTSG